MFSSLTSWLSGGSEPVKEGDGDGEKKSSSEETKEGENQPQSELETAGSSWTGRNMPNAMIH